MKNFLINAFIFLLILAGTIMIGWHFIQEEVIRYYTQVTINPEEFEANLLEAEHTAVFDLDVVSTLEAWDWLQHVGIGDEVSPIGELIMPSIGVRLPIFHGVDEPNISIGAGTLFSDRQMGEGNYVLASHWDPNPGLRFGGLDLIQPGDILILRDSHYLYLYETIIGDNYVIGEYRWDITYIEEGETWLTLFTCTPPVGNRRVDTRIKVRGNFIERLSIAEINEMIELAEELEEMLGEVAEVVDLAVITEVIETLEETRVSFPFIHVGLVILGGFLFATFIVWITNHRPKKRRR